jgi:hypothetical protein
MAKPQRMTQFMQNNVLNEKVLRILGTIRREIDLDLDVRILTTVRIDCPAAKIHTLTHKKRQSDNSAARMI